MNLMRFLSYMKHALMVVAMLTIVGISGCDDDDGPTIFKGTLVELASSEQFKQSVNSDDSKSLDSLVKYLNYHGLDVVLNGAGPFTLFAPNNAAFKNLIALPGFPADIRKIDPNIVKAVLSYHVVAGTVMKKDIVSGASFTTAFTGTVSNPDDKINVNSDGTLLTGSSNTAIQIVTSDKQATNGVLHVTATVLIPQTIGNTLTPILGTLAGSVFLGADFTYLVKVINNADQGVGAGEQIRTLLATPPLTAPTNVRRTFFAPPNAFFTAAAAQSGITVDQLIASLGTGGTSAARFILLNHIITTNVEAKTIYTVSNVEGTGDVQFTNGLKLLSNAGKELTVALVAPQTNPAQAGYNPYGVAVISPSTPPSNGAILAKDITHSNGSVLHAFGGFLKPQ